MSKQASPTRIGAFVIGAVVLVIVVVLVFGSGDLFVTKDTYVIYFRDSVNGLSVGAPVKLRGVTLGSVKSIRALIDQEGQFHVEVVIESTINILDATRNVLQDATQEEGLQYLIERGLRAQLATQSLVLGQLYIKVDYFPDDPPVFIGLSDDYPEIPSVQTVGEELQEQLASVLREIAALPIDSIAGQTMQTLAHVDSVVLSMELAGTMADLRVTLADMRRFAAIVGDDVHPASQAIAESAVAAERAIARVDSLLAEIGKASLENRDEVYFALRDLSAAARSLQALADMLQRNPDSIIWGKD